MRLWIAVMCSCWLFACSEVENPPAGNPETGRLDAATLFDANGNQTEHSRMLATCVTMDNDGDACTLQTLNFIGATTALPDKQQILDRLLVSHAWMAENFSLLLEQMPEDIYRLFASTTAIVIDSHIRPAYFRADTGAIYLDPYYLWMNAEQKATISSTEDYRSSYDDALSFKRVAQYSKQGAYPFGSGDLRSEQQALYQFSAVLFHELAHASDYFPVARLPTADITQTPADIAIAQGTQGLYGTYPLQSTILYYLAQVQFMGNPATEAQIALSASDVGAYFDIDGANDAYNYATIREDTAMLFEEAMMKIHYDIDREVAFVTVLAEPSHICSNVSFDWYANNRILDDHILPRAELVVNQLLPHNEHQGFFANPPTAHAFSLCQPASQGRGMQPHPKLEPQQYWH